MKGIFTKKIALLLVLLSISFLSFSQKIDSTKNYTKYNANLNGAITITNNGISVIPTFMLGKPAIIFDIAVGKKKLTFEPQLRFAIADIKPWSFVLWMRYKLIQGEKFKMGIGGHPSTVFSNVQITTNGITENAITVKRYLAGELTPTYMLSKNISVGLYYLYSYGFADATKTTNFVELGVNFSNIKLGGDYFMRVAPQLYYLQMDAQDGIYATSTFALSKRNFPMAVASIINKKIQSTILSDNVVWNVSLIYTY